MKHQYLAYQQANKIDSDNLISWACVKAAHKMKKAKALTLEQQKQAVRVNWRFWTIVQGEIFDTECPWPSDIKNDLVYLSNFVDKSTINFFASGDKSNIDALIKCNLDLSEKTAKLNV